MARFLKWYKRTGIKISIINNQSGNQKEYEMEIKVYIYGTNKETKRVFIEDKLVITEEDILKLALETSNFQREFNEKCDYEASIDEIKI